MKARATRKKIGQSDQKHNILRSGENVFARKGFHVATLQEIAKSANLAKGTIYLHFTSKKQLFVSVIEEKLEILLKEIEQQLDESDSPLENIRKATRTHLGFLEQNKDFFHILQGLFSEFKRDMRSELVERVIRKNATYVKLIQALLEKAIEQHEIRALDAEKLAVLLVGMVHSLTFNWIAKQEKESLLADHDLAWEVFLGGVRAGPTTEHAAFQGGKPC